jgi:hypothetical protein
VALTRSTSAEDAALAALLAEETGDGLVSPQPADSPQPPTVHTWRWVFSAMAVVATTRFSTRGRFCFRIYENSTLKKISMKIGNQRPYIS